MDQESQPRDTVNAANETLRPGFSYGSVVKNLPANAGDTGEVDLIPGLGRFPGGENGNPL